MSALVLALNPCIDAEWHVKDVLWEEKNNVLSERRWAGGKGVNVARWLKHLGSKPRLLAPLGDRTGAELAGYLREEKLPARIIKLREPTRVNVVITTTGGRQIRFNPLGPRLSAREWRTILRETRRLLPRVNVLILSGSLPRGLPDNCYAVLIRLAHRSGVRSLLDCDGAALASAIKAHPFLVKPNEHELAQWCRRPLRSERETVRAARSLSKETRGWVLVSRGAKRALLVNHSEGFQCFANPSSTRPRNTLGAGDALLAAVACHVLTDQPPEQWLEAGVTAGTAATRCEPGCLP
jgi:1-phosphofructokinase family hexose kinase